MYDICNKAESSKNDKLVGVVKMSKDRREIRSFQVFFLIFLIYLDRQIS